MKHWIFLDIDTVWNMSKITVEFANERQLESWDTFVANSFNGTIFHKRKFLGYHGKKFQGIDSWLVILKGETVIGQLSLALSSNSIGETIALSPFGASYGGLVLKNLPTFSEANVIVASLVTHIEKSNIQNFRIIHPIACCAPASPDVLTFAMLQNGFRSINRDISSVINLKKEEIDKIVSSRARNMERKSTRAGVKIRKNVPMAELWVPLAETFQRHGSKPTHSLKELCELKERFPRSIGADVAYLKGAPIAGICYFKINQYVLSTFYFCQTAKGQQLQSLSALVMEGLRDAKTAGFHWLDFGTSSTNEIPGPDIFRFKESFSREGMFRETLEWSTAND